MRLAVLALMLAATPVGAACPNAGLKTAPVTLVTAKGRFAYQIEIAATPEQQQCGLMFRKTMKRSVGMGFPFPVARQATFWMENTPLPLDLIFVGPDGRVDSVGAGAPFSRDLIASAGLTAEVIELNAGEVARIGLRPGDRVER